MANACTACQAGKYAGFKSVQCTDCPNGSYSVVGSDSCTPAPAGAFPNSAKSGFVDCPLNTYRVGDQIACTPCADGKFSNRSDTSCSACAPGTVVSTNQKTGQQFCQVRSGEERSDELRRRVHAGYRRPSPPASLTPQKPPSFRLTFLPCRRNAPSLSTRKKTTA